LNGLQDFLNQLPQEILDFFETLPAEAQRAFRMAYAGGQYWTGERPEDQLVVGEYMVALVNDGNFALATQVAMQLSTDPGGAYQVAVAWRDGVTAVADNGGGTIDDVVIASASFDVDSADNDSFRGLSINAERSNVNVSSTALFQEAMSWYDVNSTMPSMSFTARHDSLVGKLFLGLIQKLDEQQNDPSEQIRTALLAEAVTDIPAWKILKRTRNDWSVNPEGMQLLFDQAEYDDLFDQPVDENTAPTLRYANVDRPTYTEGDVRIRFDVLSEGKTLDYVEVFREGDNTSVVSNRLGGSRNRLFAEIPVSVIGMSGENMHLNLVVHFEDGTTADLLTEVFSVDPNHVMQNALTLDDMNLVPDYEGHLGSDYEAPEGTPFLWNGPNATVIGVLAGTQTEDEPLGNGYGTMAIMLEITLDTDNTFTSEMDNINITTNKIRVVIGHLRPSSVAISNDDPSSRLANGFLNGDIRINEESITSVDQLIGKQISSGTVLGFLESTEYGGASTNPHVHVSMYDASTPEVLQYLSSTNKLWAGVLSEDSPDRQHYIRPELAWAILLQTTNS
jgi:hypothetical protein